ncbi:MAG TPA: hypothetical protein PK156_42295 [Polyangium sp.]|nr:hypothetical protein [Polyangium sp.]
MVSNAKQFVSYVFVALALAGCIIVVPPPGRNDPFQPPGSAPIKMAKGGTHRFRLNCGAQATFQSPAGAIENLVIDYNAENLSSVSQVPSAAVRLTWRGPGTAMDIPFNVGSKNTRSAMGSITMNGPAGAHTFTVAMPQGPDCGATNVKVIFK